MTSFELDLTTQLLLSLDGIESFRGGEDGQPVEFSYNDNNYTFSTLAHTVEFYIVQTTANKEAEQLLTEELQTLKEEVPDREQLFYDLVKDRYGAVPSEGGRYIVALNEFSVFFPATVANPYYKGEEVELD